MVKKRIYIALFVFLICFIWGNSMLSTEVSGAISHFIADIFGGESGASDEGHFLLRKLGHFTEFAALGVISALLFALLCADQARKYLLQVTVGLFVPLMDETIQIFSGRGYSLIDVWIDISGYAVGTAVAILFVLIKKRSDKKKSINNQPFVKDVHKE